MAEIRRPHTIPGYDDAIDSLRRDVILLCNLVSRTLSNACRGLKDRDDDYCSAVIADDEEIDLLQKQVDRAGTQILLKFQPVAFDLRQTVATIKVGSHLERVSDEAVFIARRARLLNAEEELQQAHLIDPLFDAISSVQAEAVQAFGELDSRRAERVLEKVEALAQQARDLDESYVEWIDKWPERARAFINCIEISQRLERMIYVVENIAQEVIYVSDARDVRHPGNTLE